MRFRIQDFVRHVSDPEVEGYQGIVKAIDESRAAEIYVEWGDGIRQWCEAKDLLRKADSVKEDPIVQRVVDKFRQRSAVGVQKYGTTLDRPDVDLIGWLRHFQEELMDGVNYAEAMIARLKQDTEEVGK